MEPMRDIILSLVTMLAQARCFEEAAEGVLAPVLRLCSEALSASPFHNVGRILRGMVHLRPADGYRRLVIVEEPALRRGEPRARPAPRRAAEKPVPVFLPSATAWRWVAEHRCPVSIDVTTGKVWTHAGDAAVVVQEHGLGGEFNNQESVQRLLSRETTHVHVIPIRALTGTVEGMISIEADCRSAIGQEFILSRRGGDLQFLVGIAAPYLANLPLRPGVPSPDQFLPVMGPSMAGLLEMLRVFSIQDETILLTGPTGAGKSKLARWCHEHSQRRKRRFESVDLMTVPENLQQGEFFGWKKGAFTDALADNVGCLARAEGGTLFIDEIDKLSLNAQAALLRVLDERRYRPIGDSVGERVADVRFIIGTNADLHAAVREGRFREDLYYRINVLSVRIPPLAERVDEIPLWACYMANRRHRETNPTGAVQLTPEAEQVLSQERWPGNLRQLDNIVRRAYAMAIFEYGSAQAEMVLHARHFKRALEGEAPSETALVTDLLCAAAAAFVREAERLGPAAGGRLNLGAAESFIGFVLGTAVRKLGGKDEAFRLLGRESLVANRNHHKTLRRELEKVKLLYETLKQPGMPFCDLLESEGEP